MNQSANLIKHISRSSILTRARLHILSKLMYGITVDVFDFSDMRWTGDLEGGTFTYSNGSGDILAMAWDKDLLVACIFDHESQRSHIGTPQDPNAKGLTPDQDPKYYFPNIPENCNSLLGSCNQLLEDAGGDTNVTACLWADHDSAHLPESKKKAMDNGLWMLENYINPIEKAVIDPDAKVPEPQKDFYFSAIVGDIQAPVDSAAWRFHYSLSQEQSELLLSLDQELLETWNYNINADQWNAFKIVSESIVDPTTGKKKRGTPENYKKIREILKKIGIEVA